MPQSAAHRRVAPARIQIRVHPTRDPSLRLKNGYAQDDARDSLPCQSYDFFQIDSFLPPEL